MAGFTNQDLNLMFTTVVWENIKKTLTYTRFVGHTVVR